MEGVPHREKQKKDEISRKFGTSDLAAEPSERKGARGSKGRAFGCVWLTLLNISFFTKKKILHSA